MVRISGMQVFAFVTMYGATRHHSFSKSQQLPCPASEAGVTQASSIGYESLASCTQILCIYLYFSRLAEPGFVQLQLILFRQCVWMESFGAPARSAPACIMSKRLDVKHRRSRLMVNFINGRSCFVLASRRRRDSCDIVNATASVSCSCACVRKE